MKPHEKNSTADLDHYFILGIDPGSIHCGYGLIETFHRKNSGLKAVNAGSIDCRYVTAGRISLSSKKPLSARLKKLYDALVDIMRSYEPREMVIESMFFAKSIRAAFSLGQVRGIALLAAQSEDLSIHEYSALEVKKAVTGYGNAAKSQVKSMVMRILNLDLQDMDLSEDSADALAIALCHFQNMKFRKAAGI